MKTYSIVKHQDESKWSTYLVKNINMEIYNALAESQNSGQPCQPRLYLIAFRT